ncbi:MAG: hypothetical protein ACI8Z1_000664 [Candidatus Azotimanducaceae bacterium]|jgi:hypothetical protein
MGSGIDEAEGHHVWATDGEVGYFAQTLRSGQVVVF